MYCNLMVGGDLYFPSTRLHNCISGAVVQGQHTYVATLCPGLWHLMVRTPRGHTARHAHRSTPLMEPIVCCAQPPHRVRALALHWQSFSGTVCHHGPLGGHHVPTLVTGLPPYVAGMEITPTPFSTNVARHGT